MPFYCVIPFFCILNVAPAIHFLYSVRKLSNSFEFSFCIIKLPTLFRMKKKEKESWKATTTIDSRVLNWAFAVFWSTKTKSYREISHSHSMRKVLWRERTRKSAIIFFHKQFVWIDLTVFFVWCWYSRLCRYTFEEKQMCDYLSKILQFDSQCCCCSGDHIDSNKKWIPKTYTLYTGGSWKCPKIIENLKWNVWIFVNKGRWMNYTVFLLLCICACLCVCMRCCYLVDGFIERHTDSATIFFCWFCHKNQYTLHGWPIHLCVCVHATAAAAAGFFYFGRFVAFNSFEQSIFHGTSGRQRAHSMDETHRWRELCWEFIYI